MLFSNWYIYHLGVLEVPFTQALHLIWNTAPSFSAPSKRQMLESSISHHNSQGLEQLHREETLRELCLFSMGKRWLWEDL